MRRFAALLVVVVGCGDDEAPPSTTDDTTLEYQGPLTGLRVAAAEDVTGDAQPDLLVAAQGIDGRGGIYGFPADASGELGKADAAFEILGAEKGDIGEGLSVCPDLNGDGSPDLLVGAPRGNDAKGGVWLLNGPLEGTIATTDAEFMEGRIDSGQEGYTVSCEGDWSGDGLSDMAVAAPTTDGFGDAFDAGEITFHEGTSDGPDRIGAFNTTWSESFLGIDQSVSLRGDLNGDGLSDLLLGAHGIDRVYLVEGPLQGTYDANTAGITFVGEPFEGTGHALDSGDINGDGHTDLIIGAPWAEAKAGAVWFVEGPFDAKSSGQLIDLGGRVFGVEDGDQAGFSVAFADDLDGDGLGDVIAGAPFEDRRAVDAGAVYVISGPGTGAETLEDATPVFRGLGDRGHFGWSVRAVPDANGDGTSEILVGAPHETVDGRFGAGRAYLFHSPFSGSIDADEARASFVFEEPTAGGA